MGPRMCPRVWSGSIWGHHFAEAKDGLLLVSAWMGDHLGTISRSAQVPWWKEAWNINVRNVSVFSLKLCSCCIVILTLAILLLSYFRNRVSRSFEYAWSGLAPAVSQVKHWPRGTGDSERPFPAKLTWAATHCPFCQVLTWWCVVLLPLLWHWWQQKNKILHGILGYVSLKGHQPYHAKDPLKFLPGSFWLHPPFVIKIPGPDLSSIL